MLIALPTGTSFLNLLITTVWRRSCCSVSDRNADLTAFTWHIGRCHDSSSFAGVGSSGCLQRSKNANSKLTALRMCTRSCFEANCRKTGVIPQLFDLLLVLKGESLKRAILATWGSVTGVFASSD